MKKTVEFIGLDGNPYTFKACVNDMSGDQMWWLEIANGDTYGGMHVGGARSQYNGIKKNCVVKSETDDCDHPLAR